MQGELVSLTVGDHIAIVTVNRPPVNALNDRCLEELTAVFDSISGNPEVRVVILTATGNVFCAGGDRSEPRDRLNPQRDLQRYRAAGRAFFAISDCRQPTIAAINGPAVGAGVALAASCDIVVAVPSAHFSLPEVDAGTLGGARHAMRLFGHSLTRRMMLTGNRVTAAELRSLGVKLDVATGMALMAHAHEIASGLAAKDPEVLQEAKHAINVVEHMSLREGYAFEQIAALNLLRGRTS